ncbi:unnamed protein product [Polarella glacialis]|uniref:Uncharacterized protein n=1 Tax=Polarella glacialis TaxID=89957 RepID=A0A813GVP1_POLGL|nr:unnamed protein product [Polarella glacialis]
MHWGPPTRGSCIARDLEQRGIRNRTQSTLSHSSGKQTKTSTTTKTTAEEKARTLSSDNGPRSESHNRATGGTAERQVPQFFRSHPVFEEASSICTGSALAASRLLRTASTPVFAERFSRTSPACSSSAAPCRLRATSPVADSVVIKAGRRDLSAPPETVRSHPHPQSLSASPPPKPTRTPPIHSSPPTSRARPRSTQGSRPISRSLFPVTDDELTARDALPELPRPDELPKLPLDERTYPPDLEGGILKLLKDDLWRCAGLVRGVLLASEAGDHNTSNNKHNTHHNDHDGFSQASLRAREAQLRAREFDLVGRWESQMRRVLLMWVLGSCLEALGRLETAASLFSRCLSRDPGNPVHAYHRGACLLRLGNFRGACCDFVAVGVVFVVCYVYFLFFCYWLLLLFFEPLHAS